MVHKERDQFDLLDDDNESRSKYKCEGNTSVTRDTDLIWKEGKRYIRVYSKRGFGKDSPGPSLRGWRW